MPVSANLLIPSPAANRHVQRGKTLATIIGSSAAAAALMTLIPLHESGGRQYLKAYQDSGNIWTICDGIIKWPDGRPVRKGDTATVEQCRQMLEAELIAHAEPLMQCLPQLYGRVNQVKALVDASYNLGTSAICNGSIGKRIRVGDWAGASQAILLYDRVTFPKPLPGRDCVKNKTKPGWACKVRGLTLRRTQNKAMFDIARPPQGVR